MKHVEDAMREMVNESMNVYVGEVVKQVSSYSSNSRILADSVYLF